MEFQEDDEVLHSLDFYGLNFRSGLLLLGKGSRGP